MQFNANQAEGTDLGESAELWRTYTYVEDWRGGSGRNIAMVREAERNPFPEAGSS
jgi:hypothetical protein